MASITINGITLNPVTQGPALAAARLHSADASGSNYLLVQTKSPLTTKQRQDLEKKGATILEYVPENTYICQYTPTDLGPIRSLPFVQWANTYLKAFKINPSLVPDTNARPTRNLMEAHALVGGQLSLDPHLVDIVLHRSAKTSSIRKKIAEAAGVDESDVQITGDKVRLRVAARVLPKLADLDEVRHIESVSRKKLHNDVARTILGVGVPLGNGTVLEGEGQIVAVCDTGLDKGSKTDVHPAFAGRVLKLYALGRPDKSNDPNGHGTHVAGSVLGDGNSAALGIQVRGTAPRAQLVLQSVLDSLGGLGGLPADLRDLFQNPYGEDGARVHINSWSNTQGSGQYNSECFELDDFVWNHRDIVICFAAGNDGIDSDANGLIDANSIKPPSTSKNCITVGATENDRPGINLTYGEGWPTDFPAAPIANDLVADNADGMVAFSSRGPTLDRRIKPDVVAPGTFILSARSRATSSQGWMKSEDPLYFFEGGTSMATPLVAGCAAVVREFLIRERGLTNPSAALVKAMLINGARNVVGQYVPSEAGGVPNVNEGFGRVDVAAVIGPFAAGQQVVVRDENTVLDTDEEEKTTINVPAGATMLKVTLVWTDPPGEGLQNDLDLIVRAANGEERRGNQPPNSTAFDRTNNVEQVVWEGVPSGNVDVFVRAFRAAIFPQSYALVIRIT